MTPLEIYQADLRREDFSEDPAQKEAVCHIQALYGALFAEYEETKGLITRIRKHFRGWEKTPITGLYFWGGVGRGKTYLVDAFYDCLPFAEKHRIHFHRFMQKIHRDLRQHKNIEDPLQKVADGIVADTWVLCLDEFHVTDITDAMLLGGLLKALFMRGVTLVTTSNEAPDQLYAGGLQRDRFLPAIGLIKQYTQVVQIDSGIDYRLRYLDRAEIYHYPLDINSGAMLRSNFEHIAPDKGEEDVVLEIEGRPIRTVCCADGVVWFDFRAICDGPRGPADYIEIARQFQTVLIGGIPAMGEGDNDMARRFMTLVDEFYDRNVKLIATAEVEPGNLYTGQRLAKPFQRTVSRLYEMHTHDYLARQHLS
jgi:cell division protein ZapE